jgi:hypothetical protein
MHTIDIENFEIVNEVKLLIVWLSFLSIGILRKKEYRKYAV